MNRFARVVSYALIIVAVCSCSGKPATAQTSFQQEFKRIDSFILNQLEVQHIPGIAIAITRGDQVVYAKAYGVASVATGKPLQTNHTFHIASISKTFAATAVMQLAEKGKIDIDKPLTAYLPYFRMKDGRYKNITIKQMLNHTSGMPDVDDYEWEKNVTDEGAAERYTRTLVDSSLISEPGREFHYSNIAFDLMADLVAKVSGKTFETFVKENILLPLGMRNSSFYYPETNAALRTSPHTGNPSVVSAVYPYNRMHAPSSTLNTSAEELALWAIANNNGGQYKGKSILQPATFRQMMTPTFVSNPGRNVSIGLSWFIYNYRDETNVEHGGGDLGYRTMLTIIPAKKLGIIVLCNKEEGVRIFDIRNTIRDILLDAMK